MYIPVDFSSYFHRAVLKILPIPPLLSVYDSVTPATDEFSDWSWLLTCYPDSDEANMAFSYPFIVLEERFLTQAARISCTTNGTVHTDDSRHSSNFYGIDHESCNLSFRVEHLQTALRAYAPPWLQQQHWQINMRVHRPQDVKTPCCFVLKSRFQPDV